jgi:hypothetical protein
VLARTKRREPARGHLLAGEMTAAVKLDHQRQRTARAVWSREQIAALDTVNEQTAFSSRRG